MNPQLADAHIHLFEGGYVRGLTGQPGVRIDEGEYYTSLTARYNIAAALVIGFAGEPWAVGNTAYLKKMVARHAWVKPTAYAHPAAAPTIGELEELKQAGFVGVSIYLHKWNKPAALAGFSEEFWSWLEARRWLVSVNGRGQDWPAIAAVVERHPHLRLLCSHLGLPPCATQPPDDEHAREAMANVLALARFPQVRVKISGLYALTDPGHDYPHRAAWPYIRAAFDAFGPERLLWASDFSPCLEAVTFPQAMGYIPMLSWLGETDRAGILGGNLLALIGEASEA